MARYLHVKAGVITNVVEYGAQTPPTVTPAGGQAFDPLPAIALRARAPASAQLDTRDPTGALIRAVAGVTMDELNAIRQWIEAFKAQVALATTLADLKTRVAALPAMPDRTLTQARTAIQAKITAGAVDS